MSTMDVILTGRRISSESASPLWHTANLQKSNPMLALYRSAREVYGVCQDLRQLYEIAAEYTRRAEASDVREVELISDFRKCIPCTYEEDPLIEAGTAPLDSGWCLLSSASQ